MILKRSSESFDSPRKIKAWGKLRSLLEELGTMDLKPKVQEEIVRSVQELNAFEGSDAKLISMARRKSNRILHSLEKEMNVVAANQFRTRWMALGMSIFGVPMGLAFAMALGSMAFLGIGLPIGMAVGIGLGSAMDEKARKEGRQLNYSV